MLAIDLWCLCRFQVSGLDHSLFEFKQTVGREMLTLQEGASHFGDSEFVAL